MSTQTGVVESVRRRAKKRCVMAEMAGAQHIVERAPFQSTHHQDASVSLLRSDIVQVSGEATRSVQDAPRHRVHDVEPLTKALEGMLGERRAHT